MLSSQELSDFFTDNTHPDLYPRIFAVSPDGGLLAYSACEDPKQIRDQAALVAVTIRNAASKGRNRASPAGSSSSMKALTIELETCNVIARNVHSSFVVVLVGKPSGRSGAAMKVTAETYDDAAYPEQVEGHSEDDDFNDPNVDPLVLQRLQIDRITDHLAETFEDFAGPQGTHANRTRVTT